jgi:hypothetical protein
VTSRRWSAIGSGPALMVDACLSRFRFRSAQPLSSSAPAGLAISTYRNYVRRIDDEDAEPGAVAGVVVFIGGAFSLTDVPVDTRDAWLDPRLRDVRA